MQYIYIYIYIYVCVCVCVYIYIYIYAYNILAKIANIFTREVAEHQLAHVLHQCVGESVD